MASVEKRYNKSGTLISFRIHVFHGRDEFGKQLPPFIKTVRVPPELNARQIETLIQRETVYFEEECELIIAREKEEAAKAAEPKCISFEDFAVKVMEIKERTGKEKSTLARYQDMLDSRINPYLGKTPVDEITGDMLDDFYAMLLKPGQNEKTGGGLSRKTVLEHHHVISTIILHFPRTFKRASYKAILFHTRHTLRQFRLRVVFPHAEKGGALSPPVWHTAGTASRSGRIYQFLQQPTPA